MTIFYWVWWVSWTPFAGIFLARISRGRTIREFVVGIAVVMLLSGGTDSLSSLQTIIIVAGSPFLLVVIALLVSLIRGVAEDPSRLDEKAARTVHLRMLRGAAGGGESRAKGAEAGRQGGLTARSEAVHRRSGFPMMRS